GWEACVVAQVGKVTVKASDEVFENIGQRTALFEKIPTDSVYVNRNQEITIEAITDAQVVIAYAPSDKDLPTKLIAADDIRPEHRGKYSNQRLALTILGDDDDFADSLLVVEVFTDSGNWSSYPPHKHDQNNLPEESFLEEIYYHEVNPPQDSSSKEFIQKIEVFTKRTQFKIKIVSSEQRVITQSQYRMDMI